MIINKFTSCIQNILSIRQCFTSIKNKKYNSTLDYNNKYKSDNKVSNNKQSKNKEFLYVILPYFNYCYSMSRFKLFIEFVKRYTDNENIRICIVEGRLKGDQYQLPDTLFNVYKHIAITIDDPIWIKENLINTMISMLPNNWKYVAWIDADITFLNTNWVNDTIEQLQKNDIVQLFQTAVNMGPNGEAFKIDRSFGYMYRCSGHDWNKAHKYGFWHSGYAWACTRNAYDSFGGLIDFGILGAGDHHMSLAFIGKVQMSHPDTIQDNYKKLLLKFQDKCLKNNLQLNYISGTIIHHWHGSLKNRKYVERWLILTKNNYDPIEDVYYNEYGVLGLTEKGKRFVQMLQQYFNERNEDATVNDT